MKEHYPALTKGEGHPNKWPSAMLVCSQTEARRRGAEWGPSHIISIYGPECRYLGLADFPQDKQLHLRIEDTRTADEPGAPTMADVDVVIAFVDALPQDAQLMIHCLTGTSRSAAVALGLLARAMQADKAGAELYKHYPNASPSPLLVALWDKKLDLGGKLIKAARKFPQQMLRAVGE
jgi:predicted protein tyrosine phosphatase